MRKCIMCGKRFSQKGNSQLSCSIKCKRERKRATDRVWNKERSKTSHRRQWWLEYLEKNRDKIREKNREAYQKNKYKISKESKLKRKLGVDLEKRNIRRYSWKKFRKEILAKREICEICGTSENLVLHHKEYKNSIDSILLVCRKCHGLIHKRNLKETKRVRGG